jgi:outer membrane protein
MYLLWSLAAVILPAGAAGETLADAVSDAYRSNPQLQAQRAELRALDETVIEALAPYRLGASISANIGYNERRQRGVSSDAFTVFEQRSIGTSMTISQLLSSGGRTAAQVSAAEADVLSGRERLREVENATLFEVVDAYASVLRDQQLVTIQARAVGNYERQVVQNRSRETEGDLAMTDVAQAEAQLFIIRAALAQARASLEQSRSRFAAAVGRNPGALDAAPALPNVPAASDVAQRAAGDESPILWQAILSERASGHRIAAARAERAPSISAQGSFGYVNPQGFRTRDLGSNIGGSINLTVPFFAQGVIGSRVRSAIAQQQSATFRVEEARRIVAAGVLNAWNQMVTARQQLLVGQEAVAAAEKALGGVRRGFAEGFRSNFEVIDSEQRLLNAQVLVVNARYGLFAGQATLLVFIGRLQAALLIDGAAAYDPTANLERQRRDQFGPFLPLVRAFDGLQRPSGRGRPAPALADDSAVRSKAGAVAPDGPLATALPMRPVDAPPTVPFTVSPREKTR